MIHYTIKGEGHPVVLVHGFPNDSSAWEPVVPQLARQYQVLLPDLPGAGRSALPAVPLTLDYMAAMLKDMLDRAGIRKAVLVGHSMGGYTILHFAQQYPEYLLGISLVHSLASADSEEKKENRRKAIALMRKGDAEKEVFLRGMAQNLFAPEYASAHPEAVKKVVSGGMQLPVETLVAFYQAIMERSDKREILPHLSCPLQWIIGEQDTATPMRDALEQCYMAPVNQVALYRDCGHMSFVEKSGELVADLQQFLHYCYTR